MAVRFGKMGSRNFRCVSLLRLHCPYNFMASTAAYRRFVHVGTITDNGNPEDIRGKGLELFETLQKKGVSNRHQNSFLSLYQYLLVVGIDQDTLGDQFLETPDLIDYHVSRWKRFCEIMIAGGVPTRTVFRNIARCPEVLQISEKVLEGHIEKLTTCYVGKYKLLELVESSPQVFAYPVKAIVGRLRKLASIFNPIDLKILVKNNPSIVTDSWNDVNEKLLYINEKMGLDQDLIAPTEALQKSLLHLKIRHQFLFRAGLYTTPNLTKDYKSHMKNHELSMITDTSNKIFVNKLARLSIDEYEVFCRMMKEEHDLLSDEDSDGLYSDE